jgi:hypothetical protein
VSERGASHSALSRGFDRTAKHWYTSLPYVGITSSSVKARSDNEAHDHTLSKCIFYIY